MRINNVFILLKALYQGTEFNLAQGKISSKKGFFANLEKRFAHSFFTKRLLDIGVEIFKNIFYVFLAYLFSVNLLNNLNAGIPVELVLTLAPLPVLLFALMFGVFFTKEALFNTKDNDLLMAMPFSSAEILVSRLLYVFLVSFSHLTIMHLGTAAFLYFSHQVEATVLQALIYLIVPLLINLSLILCVAVVLFPIYYIFQKIKKIKLLDGMFTLFIFIVSMAFSLFYNATAVALSRSGKGMITQVSNNIHLISSIFPPYQFYVNMVSSTHIGLFLQNLLSLVVLLLVLGGILSFLAHKMYFPILSQMSSVHKLSAKALLKEQAKAQRLMDQKRQSSSKHLVWKALVFENNKMFSDSVVFFINHFITTLFLPVVFLGALLYGAYEAGMNFESFFENGLEQISILIESLSFWIYIPEVSFYVFIVLSFILVFFQSPISSYIFSKEGKNFTYLRALPVHEYQLYFSRTQYVFLHQLYFNLLSILGTALLVYLGAYKLAFLTGLMIFAQCFTNAFISSLFDLWNPSFEFSNEQQLLKRNWMGLLALLPNLLVFGFPVLSAFIILDVYGMETIMNFPYIPLLYAYFFVILIIEVTLLKVLVPKLIKKVV